MFHATYLPSRRFLSNIPQWWISSATTKRPLSHGLLTKSPSAAAPIGQPSDQQHSIHLRTIGSYRALPSHRCCPLRSLSWPKALFRTRCFPRNGNFLSSKGHPPVVQTKRHPIHAQIDDPDVGLRVVVIPPVQSHQSHHSLLHPTTGATFPWCSVPL